MWQRLRRELGLTDDRDAADSLFPFQKYPPDFFDLIIVDECHRGSANEKGQWRDILEYFF